MSHLAVTSCAFVLPETFLPPSSRAKVMAGGQMQSAKSAGLPLHKAGHVLGMGGKQIYFQMWQEMHERKHPSWAFTGVIGYIAVPAFSNWHQKGSNLVSHPRLAKSASCDS